MLSSCWLLTISETESSWVLGLGSFRLLSSADGSPGLKCSEGVLHLPVSHSLCRNCCRATLSSLQRRAYSSGLTAELTRQRVLQKAKALCWVWVRITVTSANMNESAGSQHPTNMSTIRPKVRASRMSILMRACPDPAAPWRLVMEDSWRWAFHRMRA